MTTAPFGFPNTGSFNSFATNGFYPWATPFGGWTFAPTSGFGFQNWNTTPGNPNFGPFSGFTPIPASFFAPTPWNTGFAGGFNNFVPSFAPTFGFNPGFNPGFIPTPWNTTAAWTTPWNFNNFNNPTPFGFSNFANPWTGTPINQAFNTLFNGGRTTTNGYTGNGSTHGYGATNGQAFTNGPTLNGNNPYWNSAPTTPWAVTPYGVVGLTGTNTTCFREAA